MVRTQIQLTEEQSTRLKEVAARRGVSIAELIRQGIDSFLSQTGERSQEELYRRAVQAAGRFHSGTHNAALRHDEYLTEEYRK